MASDRIQLPVQTDPAARVEVRFNAKGGQALRFGDRSGHCCWSNASSKFSKERLRWRSFLCFANSLFNPLDMSSSQRLDLTTKLEVAADLAIR